MSRITRTLAPTITTTTNEDSGVIMVFANGTSIGIISDLSKSSLGGAGLIMESKFRRGVENVSSVSDGISRLVSLML